VLTAGLIAAAKADLVKPPQTFREVTPDKLYNLVSSAQEAKENKERLDKEFGGTLQLAASLGVDLIRGLSGDQVVKQREKFGNNCFPEPPMKGFWRLFFEAFQDTILLVLIAAAVVSLIVGMIEEPGHGWIEGVAILIAVLIVALVTAANDYSKELQFRALEKTSEETERAMVLRNGETMQVGAASTTLTSTCSMLV
jgi:P-type Ca2+ transporter type 2B